MNQEKSKEKDSEIWYHPGIKQKYSLSQVGHQLDLVCNKGNYKELILLECAPLVLSFDKLKTNLIDVMAKLNSHERLVEVLKIAQVYIAEVSKRTFNKGENDYADYDLLYKIEQTIAEAKGK